MYVVRCTLCAERRVVTAIRNWKILGKPPPGLTPVSHSHPTSHVASILETHPAISISLSYTVIAGITTIRVQSHPFSSIQ